MDLKVNKDHKDHKVKLDYLDLQDQSARLVQKDLWDHQD
jgi:hypothetical protein